MQRSQLFSLLRVLPLSLFVMFQVGLYSFAHLHHTNGVAVLHSHPWADADHEHSAEEWVTIDLLSHFYAGEFDLVTEIAAPVFYPPTTDEAVIATPLRLFVIGHAKPRDPPTHFV